MFPVPFKLKDEIKFIGIKWPKMLKCHVLVSLHAPASFLPSYLHEIAYQAAVQKASWKCLVLFSVFQQNSMEKQWPIITSIRLPQMFLYCMNILDLNPILKELKIFIFEQLLQIMQSFTLFSFRSEFDSIKLRFLSFPKLKFRNPKGSPCQ